MDMFEYIMYGRPGFKLSTGGHDRHTENRRDTIIVEDGGYEEDTYIVNRRKIKFVSDVLGTLSEYETNKDLSMVGKFIRD